MTASWNPSWTRRRVLGLIASAAIFAALPLARIAWAQDLDQLRAAGVIAERYDGYAMLKDPGNGGAQGVVDKVNAERQAIYAERAKQQGVTADAVGQVYATQIMAKAPSGTWFLAADGSFSRKP
jgi:uncharacterized protein